MDEEGWEQEGEDGVEIPALENSMHTRRATRHKQPAV